MADIVGGIENVAGGLSKALQGKSPGDYKSKSRKPKDSSPPGSQFSDEVLAEPPEYKRGGKVRRTGMAKVHSGERILTRRESKSYRKRGGRKRG